MELQAEPLLHLGATTKLITIVAGKPDQIFFYVNTYNLIIFLLITYYYYTLIKPLFGSDKYWKRNTVISVRMFFLFVKSNLKPNKKHFLTCPVSVGKEPTGAEIYVRQLET